MIRKTWQSIQYGLWAGVILILPVSSMPLIVRLVGSDTVAAPSGLLMLVFVITWFFPYALRGGRINSVARLFLAFCLLAFVSTLISNFIHITPYKAISPLWNNLKSLLTLLVGASFFIVTATWIDNPRKLNLTFKLINWAGLAIVIWSTLQAVYWARDNRYPEWMRAVHDLYSVGPLFRQRVSGFALEPSWLAHQLNMLFLPYWLAAAMNNYAAHRYRVGIFTFENLLLLSGAAVLWLTLSRVGLLGFLGMLAFLLIWVNIRFIRSMRARWLARHHGADEKSWLTPNRMMWVFVVTFIIGFILIVVGVGYGLSKVDPRMRSMFQIDLSRPDAILYFAERLTFASRVVYWQAGWEIFNRFPIFGVGLGNAGYFFPQVLPPYAWKLVEVRDLIFRSEVLLNIKSLWVRLLAECGIAGFSVFIGMLYFITRQAVLTWRQSDRQLRTIGLMGVLVVIGLIFEAFSIDSFGLPYIWIALGLASSGYWVKLKI